MTVHSHLPGLLRCVLGAFLVLASASAAAAQAEFHYQYGKLTNPFSGAREYTSIPSCPKNTNELKTSAPGTFRIRDV